MPEQEQPTIGLCLIVRNEAPVIERLLRSAAPYIDTWTICDTGSTDDTWAIVERVMGELGILGRMILHRWVDFGTNRTWALELARPHADYTLMLDADEQITSKIPGVRPKSLTYDAYTLPITLGQTRYRRRMLFSNAKPWRYAGPVHEYPACSESVTEGHLGLWEVHSVHEGARSRDPQLYARDAAALQAALVDDPNNARYAFYLAQSHYDHAGTQPQQAAASYAQAAIHYRRRASMGGWREEVWFSLYRLAVIAQRTQGNQSAAATLAYQEAFECDPTRAEAPYLLGLMYRAQKRPNLSYLWLKLAMACPDAGDSRLFADREIYLWRRQLEYAVACYYVGAHAQAIQVNTALLEGTDLPEGMRSRVEQNNAFSLKATGRDTGA